MFGDPATVLTLMVAAVALGAAIALGIIQSNRQYKLEKLRIELGDRRMSETTNLKEWLQRHTEAIEILAQQQEEMLQMLRRLVQHEERSIEIIQTKNVSRQVS